MGSGAQGCGPAPTRAAPCTLTSGDLTVWADPAASLHLGWGGGGGWATWASLGRLVGGVPPLGLHRPER